MNSLSNIPTAAKTRASRRRALRVSAVAAASVALLGLPAAALASSGSPVVSGVVANSADLAGATAVAVSGHFAYTTAYAAGELTAVDISNPAAPVVAGDSGFASSLLNASNITISGGYAYVVSKNRNLRPASASDLGSNDDGSGNSLTILDIHSNPAQPAIAGTLTDASNLFGAYGIAVSGSFAYVAAQGCLTAQPCPDLSVGNSFSVIDVSNPAAPTLVTTLHNATLPSPWTGTNALQHVTSVAISGNFAYVTASYSNRLTVIDISNPSSPVIVASPQDNANLSFPVDVTVQGGFAYVADQGANAGHPQLTIVNVADPASPSIAGTLNNSFLVGAYRIQVSGPFAYLVGFGSKTVSVVDVSNPAAPILDAGLLNSNDFFDATGLALDATNQHLIVTSPLLASQQFALYPPFPVGFPSGPPPGPPETGTVSVLTLDPQPTAVSITASSEPAAVTTGTSASFQFQTSNDVVTMRCKLDGAAFGLCTTPSSQQYSGLAVGSHTFTVEAIDASGAAATASYSWAVGTPPANSGAPTIAGKATSGNTLLAAAGTWAGAPAPTFAYQWNRCPAAGGTCSAIAGASTATYALSAADVGSTIDVVVTAGNGAGSASATSARTATVAPPASPTVTKLSLSKAHGKYAVHLTLSSAGRVTLIVRRTKPKLGPVLVRLTRTLPAGPSALTVKFRAKRGATYSVVATAPGGARRLNYRIKRH
jgi:hypothetical protein